MIISLLLVCAGMSHGQTSVPPALPDREITIVITQLDKSQNPVEIRAEDLKVTDDGNAQSISRFQKITDSAVTVTIIIDISVSQEHTLDAQKGAATSFINSIIHPDRDLAAVVTLTNIAHVEQQPTNDLELVRAAIARAKVAMPIGSQRGGVLISASPPGKPAAITGASAIWEVIVTICEGSRFPSDVNRRRAIILLTDGQDTASAVKLPRAVECAARKNIAVYTIGIGDAGYGGVNKNDLTTLSNETGGKAYFPKKTIDLSTEFEEIGKLLRNYYVLNYNSTVNKPTSKLRIAFADPKSKGIQLLYKQVASH